MERRNGRDAINTLPNWISLARLLTGAGLAYHTLRTKGKPSVGSTIALGVNAASDMLDGKIARDEGPTILGEQLDPAADITTVLGQLIALAAHKKYSKILLGLIISREVDIKLKRNKLSHQGISLPASPLSKAKTVTQVADILARRFPYTSERKAVTRTTAAIAVGLTGISWIDLRLRARQAQKEYSPGSTPYPVYWDCDGVLVGKHHKFNVLGRATKAFPPVMEDVAESLEAFSVSGDFTNVVVATSRDELLRGRQTKRQLQSSRSGNIFDQAGGDILYSDRSYTKKLKDVLELGVADRIGRRLTKDESGAMVSRKEVRRVVLVDDSDKKIVKAIVDVARDPQYTPLLNQFAYVNFGHTLETTYQRARALVAEYDTKNEVSVRMSEDAVILQTNNIAVPLVAMPTHGKVQAKRVMDAIRNLPPVLAA